MAVVAPKKPLPSRLPFRWVGRSPVGARIFTIVTVTFKTVIEIIENEKVFSADGSESEPRVVHRKEKIGPCGRFVGVLFV